MQIFRAAHERLLVSSWEDLFDLLRVMRESVDDTLSENRIGVDGQSPHLDGAR